PGGDGALGELKRLRDATFRRAENREEAPDDRLELLVLGLVGERRGPIGEAARCSGVAQPERGTRPNPERFAELATVELGDEAVQLAGGRFEVAGVCERERPCQSGPA